MGKKTVKYRLIILLLIILIIYGLKYEQQLNKSEP